MIILTDNKIEVSLQMMQDANMHRGSGSAGSQFGVPIDPTEPKHGLSWKNLFDLTEADYDRIEQYFLNKQAK